MEGLIRQNNSLAKGFGFIESGKDKQKRDYFFHREDYNGIWNDLVDDIASGKRVRVTFEPNETHKGPRASNVERIE